MTFSKLVAEGPRTAARGIDFSISKLEPDYAANWINAVLDQICGRCHAESDHFDWACGDWQMRRAGACSLYDGGHLLRGVGQN